MSVYKTYDIRGKYPVELNYNFAYDFGRRLVKKFGINTLYVLGKDGRVCSQELVTGLIAGITDQGANVINYGLCSTPQLYACTRVDNDEFANNIVGVMVTASHNPPDYGGFKVCTANAVPVTGDELLKIGQIQLENLDLIRPATGELISETNNPAENEHMVLRNVVPPATKTVSVDFSNGVAVQQRGYMFKPFHNKFVFKGINYEVNGNFPGHPPNPLDKDNLEQLKDHMEDYHSVLGICYDGDGDRAVFIDETVGILDGDETGAIIAHSMRDCGHLKKGDTIVLEWRCSQLVRDYLEDRGYNVVLCRTGHSYIKQKMAESNAVLGIEYSGHFYFRKTLNAESTAFATMMVLWYYHNNDTAESLLHEVGTLTLSKTDELSFKVQDANKSLEAVKEQFKDALANTTIGIPESCGLYFKFDDGWFILRKSGTEPVLRFIAETKDQEGLIKSIKEMI